jgi:PAS domain S-box-containing protein
MVLLCLLGVMVVQSGEVAIAGLLPGEAGFTIWVFAFGLTAYLVGYLIHLPDRPLALISLDFVLIVVLVALTGGVHSVAVPLYFGLILAAGHWVRPQAAVILAGLACLAQLAIWGAYEEARTRDVIPFGGAVSSAYLRPQDLWRPTDFWLDTGTLLAQLLGLILLATLTAILAWRRQHERELHQAILATLDHGIVTIDRHGRVLYANDRARWLLGLATEVPLDQPLATLVPAANLPALEALLSRCEAYSETSLTDGAGSLAPIELVTRFLRDLRGRVIGSVGVLADLTVRRRLERAIARAERLEATAKMAAAIAHELRNPLASIRGCAQEVASEPGLDPAAREMMSIVVSESDRLDRIIGEFLAYARLPDPRFAALNVAQLLREVRLLLLARGAPGQVQVSASEELTMLADRGQLIQVLLNLGLNAIQASPAGGVVTLAASSQPLRRAIRYDLSGNERVESTPGVRLVVEDRGSGIAPEARAHLFDPFFTTRKGGSGMGLAVVGRIVDAHRGTIRVDSVPGWTRVAIWLPADPSLVAPWQRAEPEAIAIDEGNVDGD